MYSDILLDSIKVKTSPTQQRRKVAKEPQQAKPFYLSGIIESCIAEKRLDLWGEYVQVTDDDLINLILPALPRSSWKAIDLRRSSITLRGLHALGKALQKENYVTELCLGSMMLGNEGLTAIASYLPGTNIETLNLFDNGISDSGIQFLCQVLPRTKVKVLKLNNNNITDDSALSLCRATGVERLILNMNKVTSFGADELIHSMKTSSLRYVGLRGNDETTVYSTMYLGWIMAVSRSQWYRVCIDVLSARAISRIGCKSGLQVLPNELIRKLVAMLSDREELAEQSLELVDLEDDEDDRVAQEEDCRVALTNCKRRCSSFGDFDIIHQARMD